MTRKQFRQFQSAFFTEAHELMQKKNADYATGGDEEADAFSNFSKITDYPEQGISMTAGVFARFLDKVSRFSKLLAGADQQVNDESIRDTAIDIANYASIMLGMVMEENKKKQDAPPPFDLDLDITTANY